MYVGTKELFQNYDLALLEANHKIEELVDLASDALYRHLDQYQSYAFLIGPGNNGADGLSLGLKLALNKKEVQFYCLGEHRSKANQYYLDQVMQFDIPVTMMSQESLELFKEEMNLYDVVVDCLFGFGLNNPLAGIYVNLLDLINESYNNEVVAVDIPSGMYCNHLNGADAIVKADLTITLTALKESFLNPASHDYTGKIIIEYLDAPRLHERLGFGKIIDKSRVVEDFKTRNYDDYKHKNGLVLHFTGSTKYRGASVLACKAAVYGGSGIVALSSAPVVEQAVTQHCPEVVFDHQDGANLERNLAKYDAVLLGSGLGISLESIKTTFSVLQSSKVPIVIDGDGLTIVAKRQEVLSQLQAPVILTPHLGEFKRFGALEKETDLMMAAIQFARFNKLILVLKGPNTIITDGYRVYRNSTGTMALATAGSGDVLAGLISSFLGQGYPPLKAAYLAVYFHGLAGERVAKKNYMAVASQVILALPEVMQEYEQAKMDWSK